MSGHRLRDIVAGLTLAAIGLFFFVGALSYPLGTALRMGAGYFPMLLGAITVFIGLAIAFIDRDATEVGTVAWRPLVAIVAAIALFGATLRSVGLVPASFLAATICGLGAATARPAIILLVAATVSLMAWAIFIIGLGLPIRPFRLHL